MSDLREKVAMAIIEAFSKESPDLAEDMKMTPDAWMGEADSAIKAVLDALKEPSEEMVRAGCNAFWEHYHTSGGYNVETAYKAAIQAFTRDHYLSALGEEDGREL